jgi:hypothetical protein
MQQADQFIGGEFAWFTGVVEDRNDPLEMNRVRVRCFGYHSEIKAEIPVEKLPWASVMMPTTSSGTSGIGDTPHGLMEGSWVVGFFRDGPSAQDPIIMGSVAAKNSPRNKDLGFTGEEYPRAEYQNKSDINKAARETTHINSKQLDKRKTQAGEERPNVQTARPADVKNVAVSKAAAYYEENTWQERPPMSTRDLETGEDDLHIPEYPYNKVNESEGGHLTEIDDTPGFKRTHRMHASGTYEEIYNNGTRQVKVIGEDYEIIISNKNIHIKGNCNMTVEGDLRQMVYGNYHLQVEKDMTMNVKGSLQTKIGGNQETEVVRSRSTHVTGNDNLTVVQDITETIVQDKFSFVDGKRIETIGKNMSLSVFGTEADEEGLSIVTAGPFDQLALKNYTLTVDANQVIGVTGTLDQAIDDVVTETYGAEQNTTAGGDITIVGGSDIHLNP